MFMLTLVLLNFVTAPARAYQITTPAERWRPTSATFALVGYKDRQFMPYMTSDPARGWALTRPFPNRLRFELRHGDVNPYDFSVAGNTKERTEIGTVERFPRGTPVHASYVLTLEDGPKFSNLWTVLGQMHQEGVSTPPPFGFIVARNGMLQAVVRSGGTRPDETYNLTTLARGRAYAFDLYFLGGPEGRVRGFIDGAPAFDYVGPVGMTYGGDFYFKVGIYRDATEPTLAVTYDNLSIASGAAVTFKPGTKRAPCLRAAKVVGGAFTGRVVAPAGARLTIFEDGVSAQKIVVGWAGWASFSIPLHAGVHAVTTAYAEAAESNALYYAVGTAAEALTWMDRLTNLESLNGLVLTGESNFTVPATTDLRAFVATNARALSTITGAYGFVKYAGGATWRRADYYDAKGAFVISKALPVP